MSLAATVLQNIRLKNNLDKNEGRLSEYGAFNFFVQQSEANPLLSAEAKELAKKSAGRSIQIPVVYDGGVTVSNARTCTVADSENTSALTTVTFVTYAVGFTIVPAMYSNNEIEKEKDIQRKYLKCARALGAALDTAALTALEAGKTKVLGDSLIYGFQGDTVIVPFASREDILGDIEPMMASNDFYGQVNIIGNVGVRSLLGKLMEKGTYNEVDKSIEWAGKRFHTTNRLANEDGNYATFYAVEDGNVDLLLRYDREAVLGTDTKVGHSWDIVTMPYVDIPVGLHYYEGVGDMSEIAGDATADLTCAKKEYYGFSVDVAFVTTYNHAPSTEANPIVKVEIGGGDTYAKPVVVVNGEENPIPTKAITE